MLRKGLGGLYKASTMEERRKRKASRVVQISQEGREIRSCLLMFDLKDGKLWYSGKEEEGKTFHKLHVLEMNDHFGIEFMKQAS